MVVPAAATATDDDPTAAAPPAYFSVSALGVPGEGGDVTSAPAERGGGRSRAGTGMSLGVEIDAAVEGSSAQWTAHAGEDGGEAAWGWFRFC